MISAFPQIVYRALKLNTFKKNNRGRWARFFMKLSTNEKRLSIQPFKRFMYIQTDRQTYFSLLYYLVQLSFILHWSTLIIEYLLQNRNLNKYSKFVYTTKFKITLYYNSNRLYIVLIVVRWFKAIFVGGLGNHTQPPQKSMGTRISTNYQKQFVR